MTNIKLNLSKEEVQERKLDAGVPYVIRQNNPTEGTTSFVTRFTERSQDNIELDDMIRSNRMDIQHTTSQT